MGKEIWTPWQTVKEFLTVRQKGARQVSRDGERSKAATIKDYLIVRAEGARQVQRSVKHYNLDMILAVGYRVRSPRGVQFRRWASTILKEYLIKGFAMDDERLKNPDGRPDHFEPNALRLHKKGTMQQLFPFDENPVL